MGTVTATGTGTFWIIVETVGLVPVLDKDIPAPVIVGIGLPDGLTCLMTQHWKITKLIFLDLLYYLKCSLKFIPRKLVWQLLQLLWWV
jgi:hypothetical protein